MKAADILTSEVVSIEATSTVKEAVEILQRLEIRHLPVLGRLGELLGVISDADIRNSGVPFTLRPAPVEDDNSRVVDVMTGDAISVGPHSSVAEVIDMLLEYRVGALPVLDPTSESLVGIISYVDVLRAVREALIRQPDEPDDEDV